MEQGAAITTESVYEAQQRIKQHVKKSPLLPLHCDVDGKQVYLKLENLQPIGSFKLRGACNTLLSLPPELIKDGVSTISCGNFGHAMAWMTKLLGIPCHVIVPDFVPEAKMMGVTRNGGHIIRRPMDEWWAYVEHKQTPDFPGYFIHPEEHTEILSGNGTVALEILEDLPDVDTVLIPYGSGGLSAGMGTLIKSLRPDVAVCTCEVETGCPLSAALKAGQPTKTNFTASFVTGISCPKVLPKLYNIVKEIIDDNFVMTLDEVTTAIQRLAEKNHVIAEGAGAVPVAASMFREVPGKKIVCVVSGGNIDMDVLCSLLQDNKAEPMTTQQG